MNSRRPVNSDVMPRIVPMRFPGFAFSFVLMLAAGGCCQSWQQPQPTRPSRVDGWKRMKDGTVQILGQFLLHKGETTTGNKLGVTVTDITPQITCLTPLQEPPMKEFTLRFFNPSNQQVLCETTVREGGGRLQCGKPTNLPTISVNGINTRDGWVWFDLRTTVGDETW
jgi:hypothetical protein